MKPIINSMRLGNPRKNNIIEVDAEYIYYVIIGDKEQVDKVISILKEEKVDNYVEYLCLRAIMPIAKHKENIEFERHISLKMDNIVEESQACAYSCNNSRNAYMLVCLKMIDDQYILTFPRYIYVYGNDPQKGLMNEFSRLSKNRLNTLLTSTIKPFDVIGSKKDTILYVSVLNKQKNEHTSELIKMLASINQD